MSLHISHNIIIYFQYIYIWWWNNSNLSVDAFVYDACPVIPGKPVSSLKYQRKCLNHFEIISGLTSLPRPILLHLSIWWQGLQRMSIQGQCMYLRSYVTRFTNFIIHQYDITWNWQHKCKLFAFIWRNKRVSIQLLDIVTYINYTDLEKFNISIPMRCIRCGCTFNTSLLR